MRPSSGPGRGDKGGSASSSKGPGSKKSGWAGSSPKKGDGPPKATGKSK